jgi:hypothetical protein
MKTLLCVAPGWPARFDSIVLRDGIHVISQAYLKLLSKKVSITKPLHLRQSGLTSNVEQQIISIGFDNLLEENYL